MRILILSRSATLYSTTRLVLAARARGHEVDVSDALQFYLCVKRGRPEIYFRGGPPARYDLVIPASARRSRATASRWCVTSR